MKEADSEMSKNTKFLCSLPANTFEAIYTDCDETEWSIGCRYNGKWYTEWEIYFASLDRDEGYEVLL